MSDLKEIWNTIKESLLKNDETKEKLSEIKKSIIKEYISEIKKWNKDIEDNEKIIENYLINDWSIKDYFQDIFRWCFLSIKLPQNTKKLNEVKKIISSMTEIPTSEKLSELKSEIMKLKLQWTSWEDAQEESSSNTWSRETHTTCPEIVEQENKFIKSVYQRASQQIWKAYSRWWISPNSGFDCSWLRYRAFKEEWIKFSGRLNAHAFSDADVDLKKDQVKAWDFMFWDQKPWWKKKHDSIYHIEMVISKPYTKNWKTYVRTLWSSTDAKDDCGNYVGKWVQIREREMKDYRHYGRPTYYYQLAQYEKTWSENNLIAWANKPSQNLENQVLSA